MQAEGPKRCSLSICLRSHRGATEALQVSSPSVGQLRSAVRRSHLLRLAMKGLNATEASQLVGCSPETARATYAEHSFRQAVLQGVERAFEGVDQAFEKKRLSLHEMLEEQAYESFEELQRMLREDQMHPALRVKIHQDFLDRVPETSQKNTLLRFDAAALAMAAKVAREMDAKIVDQTTQL